MKDIFLFETCEAFGVVPMTGKQIYLLKVYLYMLWAAIILPEQSVASEKEGLAVNKKGLTLKELLQQTSHHNPKVRRGTSLLSWKCSLLWKMFSV